MEDFKNHLHHPERSGHLDFTIIERTDDVVVSCMPIQPGVCNPFGTVHAGAMVWLADVTATILAIGDTEIGADGKGFPLAINLQMSLFANQRQGDIRAESRFVKKGRKVTVIRTAVTGDNGRLLAELTSTHIPAG